MFLVLIIATDFFSGISWLGIICIVLFVTWNLLLFDLGNRPVKTMTNEEFRQRFPELWDKLYLQPYWCGFWEFNDLQASLLKETKK